MCPACHHPRYEHNALGYCHHRMMQDGTCICHEPTMAGHKPFADRPRRIPLFR
jgi:hypothetical protein